MSNIQAVQDCMVAVDQVALALISCFKGKSAAAGFEALFAEVMNDANLRSAVQTAWTEYSQVPAEVKSMQLADYMTLAAIEITYVPQFVSAL